MLSNRKTAKEKVLEFPDAQTRRIWFEKDQLNPETVCTASMASNLLAQFGIVRDDLLIIDPDRKPVEGDLIALFDDQDSSGVTVTHYCEKGRRDREIWGVIVGFQRLFRERLENA